MNVMVVAQLQDYTKSIIHCQLTFGVTNCYYLHKKNFKMSHIHNMQRCTWYTLPLPMNSFSNATMKCALPTNAMTHGFVPYMGLM